MARFASCLVVVVVVGVMGAPQPVWGIMAGSETALPADSPSKRLDALAESSPFNFAGALAITSGGFNYRGSGAALSPHWVLAAGHNLDLNDDGAPDAGLSIDCHLPGFGVYAAASFYTHPDFSGFARPSIQRDLGLLYFSTPLPTSLFFPTVSYSLQLGDEVALIGFGRSGYEDYGYTTSASLTDRRIGWNMMDSFTSDDLGGGFPALFRYDFDSPDTFGQPEGSLGNNIESIIGPGDFSGPLLIANGSGYALVGVNTFTEGYGGRFGDIGGGIILAPYLDWISETTGLAIPEPSGFPLLVLGLVVLVSKRWRGQWRGHEPPAFT